MYNHLPKSRSCFLSSTSITCDCVGSGWCSEHEPHLNLIFCDLVADQGMPSQLARDPPTWIQASDFQQHHAPALLWTPSTLKIVSRSRWISNYRSKFSRVVGYQALGKKKWRCWSICRCSARTITRNDLPMRRRFAQELLQGRESTIAAQIASSSCAHLLFSFVSFVSPPRLSASLPLTCDLSLASNVVPSFVVMRALLSQPKTERNRVYPSRLQPCGLGRAQYEVI